MERAIEEVCERTPNPEATKAYDQGYEVYRALYATLKRAFKAVAGA